MAPLDELRQAYNELRDLEYRKADYVSFGSVDVVTLVSIESQLAEKGTELADKLADIMGWNGEA